MASNDLLGAGAMSMISTWVLFFYTTFCGLTAAEATIIFVVARLLDAFFESGRSAISRTISTAPGSAERFGAAALLHPARDPAVAELRADVGERPELRVLPRHLLSSSSCVYAMEIIPYETLAAEMSTDYRTKAKFAGRAHPLRPDLDHRALWSCPAG